MTRDAIAAIFDRRRKAFDRLDAAVLARDYAQDCVVDSPTGGVHHGPAAVEQVLQMVFDALDVKMLEESLLIDGDSAAQVLAIEGTDSGRAAADGKVVPHSRGLSLRIQGRADRARAADLRLYRLARADRLAEGEADGLTIRLERPALPKHGHPAVHESMPLAAPRD